MAEGVVDSSKFDLKEAMIRLDSKYVTEKNRRVILLRISCRSIKMTWIVLAYQVNFSISVIKYRKAVCS